MFSNKNHFDIIVDEVKSKNAKMKYVKNNLAKKKYVKKKNAKIERGAV